MSPEPVELVGVESPTFEPKSYDESLPVDELPPEPMALEVATEPEATALTAGGSHEYALAA